MTVPNQRDPDGTDILGQVRDDLAALKANVISRWGRIPTVTADPAPLIDGMLWMRSDRSGMSIRSNGVTSGLPLGFIGYNTIVANSSSVSAVTDAGPTVTWTALANRRYKTTIGGNWSGSNLGDLLIAYITDGAGTGVQRQTWTVQGGGWMQVMCSVVETVAAGSTTRKFRHERNTGAGTSTIVAAAASPAFILVEDIGPA